MISMKYGLSETCHLLFSTLSNPTRLAILEVLREGAKNVTEISKTLNQEQSMISHNLKPLERCKFVFSEKRKKERVYSLNKETMEPMFKIFAFHAQKYCPQKGKCLQASQKGRRKEASNPLYIVRY